jgi:hypothetical protein
MLSCSFFVIKASESCTMDSSMSYIVRCGINTIGLVLARVSVIQTLFSFSLLFST